MNDEDDDNKPISLKALVGGGYDEFWTTRRFYRVVRGSKGSKKSKTTALWYIYHIMKYPMANTLVIRKVADTLEGSCYSDLLWAIDKLRVTHLWNSRKSPMKLEYKPTGQVILFRGLDKPEKLMSITVRKGYLCWVWFEEASEIVNEDDFLKIVMSIRGRIDPATHLWKQVTVTFNPWSDKLWLKARFFDYPHDNVFADVTTYKDNEFLDESDIERYEDLYITNPRMAMVICDGNWGIAEGQIYTNWETKYFDPVELSLQPGNDTTFGLDFGYAISYNAFVALIVNMEQRTIWVFDEMYSKGMSNIDIAKEIIHRGYGKERIIADSAEQKSIYELQQGFDEVHVEDGLTFVDHWALPGIEGAMKGGDSVANGIQRCQSFHVIVHPDCINFIKELSSYCYEKDKDGQYTGKPIKEYDHLMDAWRYSMEKFFIHGHGRVAEAHGSDYGRFGYVPPKQLPSKCKRVVSTL